MSQSEATMRYIAAKGYVQAAKMIYLSDHYKDHNVTLTILPMHMLCGFSLELYLKAWLLGSKIDSKSVRKKGHDIVSLYDDAVLNKLPEITGLSILKSNLAKPHSDYTFRYLEEGDVINIANWQDTFKTLYDLDVAVDTLIGASASQGLLPGH